ncbi:MAG TPA: diphosphomevalonate decarboxylase [Longimicrobiales bacterium]|nr:diphosphomevalonate decarboxylase [Longimicrobiales bacterium]
MTAVSVSSPANIALIKYWGAVDLERALPLNPSISMTLRECRTVCTADRIEGSEDIIQVAAPDGSLRDAPDRFARAVGAHLDRLRSRAGHRGALRIATRNTFPTAVGLASSAAGFSALTVAVTRLLGIHADRGELAELARASGSGSAARSVAGGYVEWGMAEGGEATELRILGDAGHWDLRNVIALVDERPKDVASREGHRRAPGSPHYAARTAELPRRLDAVRAAIANRDLAAMGEVVEEEAIELHLIAMSSRPPIFYWEPGTLAVLARVRSLRSEGIAAFSTMDAGANVHVLCEPADEPAVAAALENLAEVGRVIRDGVGTGPADAEPLF